MLKKLLNIHNRRSLEAKVELHRFPSNTDLGDKEGFKEVVVKLPTRLGNLLEAYEGYSMTRYSMDAAFFWPRIWLTLDEQLKNDIDMQQAFADTSLYVSFALIISGLLSFLYFILRLVDVAVYSLLPDPIKLLALSIVIFLCSYFIYRISLHIHALFGETLKSVFDVYRGNINVDSILKEVMEDPDYLFKNEKQKYMGVSSYLDNLKIRDKEGKIKFVPRKWPNYKREKVKLNPHS